MVAHVDVSQPHSVPTHQIQAAIENAARALAEKYGVTWRWSGPNVAFESTSGVAKGVKGAIFVAPSMVRVQIELPLLLRALRATIAKEAQEILRRSLTSAP